jgi:hypothetical protein
MNEPDYTLTLRFHGVEVQDIIERYFGDSDQSELEANSVTLHFSSREALDEALRNLRAVLDHLDVGYEIGE